jgi:hypothetical protein
VTALEISTIMGTARFMNMKRAAVTLLTKIPDKNREMLIELLRNGIDVEQKGASKPQAVPVEKLPVGIIANLVAQVVDDASIEAENTPEAASFVQAYNEIMGSIDASFRLSPAGMAFRGRVRSFWQYQEAMICEQIQKLVNDQKFTEGVATRSCASEEPGRTADIVNETLQSVITELRKTMTPDEVKVILPTEATTSAVVVGGP